MAYLYGVGFAYGIGTGVWIDSLAKESDPGIAFIAPLLLGAAVPLGAYAWDYNAEFHRGVPSSIATGMLLGGVEGAAISGLQWQLTGNGGPDSWKFQTWTTITFATATGGAVGGWAFGEWLRPDPRSLALISSGAGWGAAAGIMFGSGVVSGDWKDGAAVWGFAGYNAGILAAGAVATFYVPSWQSLKYMWLGDLLGTLATTPVYLFYIGSDSDPRHGLIANAVGGLAGLGLAAALTANMSDPPGTASWTPPFQLTVSPTWDRGRRWPSMAFRAVVDHRASHKEKQRDPPFAGKPRCVLQVPCDGLLAWSPVRRTTNRRAPPPMRWCRGWRAPACRRRKPRGPQPPPRSQEERQLRFSS